MDVLQQFDEHHALLFRFAYRLTGSVADAEDIVQACFLELLKPECSYDAERAPLRAWLLGIVRNQSLKRLRQRAEPALPQREDAGSPEHEALRSEVGDAVRRAVLALPETQREVLILAHYEQLPLAEIAAILQLDLGATKSRLQRARARLREALTEHAPNVERKR
jgi:RNA polymerase sigma-70 factor (ECF subfamily)